MKNPCENCDRKQEDEYGLLCDLACGGYTAWLNYQAGIKEAIEIVGKLENPYAFSDGKCIPKYEAGYNGYENCRKDIIKRLGGEIE